MRTRHSLITSSTKQLISLLAFACAFSSPAFAEPEFESLSAGKAPIQASDATFMNVSPISNGVAVDVRISGIWHETVKSEYGTFDRVNFSGGAGAGKLGDPRLPVVRRSVAVPYGGDVHVQLVSKQNPTTLDLAYPICPLQPAQPKCDTPVPFAYNPDAYVGFNAMPYAKIVEENTYRGVRNVLIEFSPTRYNAAKGTLEIFQDLRVEVTTDSPRWAETAQTLRRTLPGARREVESQILGLSRLLNEKTPLPETPIHYVVVLPDTTSTNFEQSLEPLLEWKRAKGFKVTTLRTSQIGTSKNEIKSALRNLYENPDAALGVPDYVLLIGDVQFIPSFEVTIGGDGMAADMLYGTMDGDSDRTPEFHIGRMSVKTATELDTVVRKTLAYEKGLNPTADWYHKVL